MQSSEDTRAAVARMLYRRSSQAAEIARDKARGYSPESSGRMDWQIIQHRHEDEAACIAWLCEGRGIKLNSQPTAQQGDE